MPPSLPHSWLTHALTATPLSPLLAAYPTLLTLLPELTTAYKAALTTALPSVTANTEGADPLDPLSAPAASSDESESGWGKYYAASRLMSEIKIDLPRLYINGLPPDTFVESPTRLDALCNILFLYCDGISADVSYRQGMHEVAGVVYHVMESCGEGMSVEHVEAATYYVFKFVMGHLISVYDPRSVVIVANEVRKMGVPPPVTRPVESCMRIVERLRSVDEALQ